MWCCLFSIYISDIKFLLIICLRYWTCFRHSDKSGYCSLYIQFTSCCGYDFMLIFSLNLGFYYNVVEYWHKYLNPHYMNIRKNLCFVVYATASLEEQPSVTSRLRASIQPAKPASLIRLLCEQLPKVYVFSAHKVSQLTVFLFLIESLISRSWLCLRSMCSVHYWHKSKEHCVFRSLEVGNTFLILRNSEAK